MNADDTVRFFDDIGYVCRRYGNRRAGWTLAPRGAEHKALHFHSLSELRHEWRVMLRHADMVEEALAAAIKMCRSNDHDREEIRRWAASGAMVELRDELDYPMCAPYMKGNANKRFGREMTERLAPYAWRAKDVDVLPRILQWIAEDDHKRLLDATAEAPASAIRTPRL